MICSVPGCKQTPDEGDTVKVMVERPANLGHLPARRQPDEGGERIPASVALTHLCPQHRQEFEKLGWLVPPESDEEVLTCR